MLVYSRRNKNTTQASKEWRAEVAYRSLSLLRTSVSVNGYPCEKVPACDLPELTGVEKEYCTPTEAWRWHSQMPATEYTDSSLYVSIFCLETVLLVWNLFRLNWMIHLVMMTSWLFVSSNSNFSCSCYYSSSSISVPSNDQKGLLARVPFFFFGIFCRIGGDDVDATTTRTSSLGAGVRCR